MDEATASQAAEFLLIALIAILVVRVINALKTDRRKQRSRTQFYQ